MTTVDDETDIEFPLVRHCPFEPPGDYRRIRESDRLRKVRLPDGRQAWAVGRYDQVRQVLTDPRFSSDRYDPRFPRMVSGPNRQPEDERTMISMDGPDHGRARGAVLGEFTLRRLETLRPRIQQVVDELIDAMLTGPRSADLVQALSLPLPSLVICELLGVPYSDHGFFQANTEIMIKRAVDAETRDAAADRVRDYMDRLVTSKEADPPDDLLGRQITRLRANGHYRHAGLVGLGFLMLLAGHETTANMISLGVVSLLEHSEQLAKLRADPAAISDAVEELLRYFSLVEGVTARLCTEDVAIGGVTIRAGEGVIALNYSANHDGAAFGEADTFDVTRSARHHVAFGFGPHQCLGQNLARMELRIVFETLFRRIPDLRLAVDVEELPFKEDALIYGLYELPVTWAPFRRATPGRPPTKV